MLANSRAITVTRRRANADFDRKTKTSLRKEPHAKMGFRFLGFRFGGHSKSHSSHTDTVAVATPQSTSMIVVNHNTPPPKFVQPAAADSGCQHEWVTPEGAAVTVTVMDATGAVTEQTQLLTDFCSKCARLR